MDKYEILEEIGDGTFGIVYKAIELETKEIAAIKKMKNKHKNFKECQSLREVKSLVYLKHENIVKLKEMVFKDNHLHLVFEYLPNNLYQVMQKKESLTENEIRSIMYQIIQGVSYMHKNGFFHRDLKPDNLLVCDNTIKIADFGLAREIRSIPPYTDYVSTRWYRAPECLLRSTNYNSPMDIWALGAIMVELFTIKPLFPGNSQKDQINKICSVIGVPSPTTWNEGLQLAKKIDLKFPINCSGCPLNPKIPNASIDAIEMMTEMLRWDPNKRPTAEALLAHPFFTKYRIEHELSKNKDYSELAKKYSLKDKNLKIKESSTNIAANIMMKPTLKGNNLKQTNDPPKNETPDELNRSKIFLT